MKATKWCRVNHRFFSQVYHLILSLLQIAKKLRNTESKITRTYLCTLYSLSIQHALSHTRYAIHATHKCKDTRTYSLTHTEKQSIHTAVTTQTQRGQVHTLSEVHRCKGWEGTEQTCWTNPVCFVIQFQVVVRNCSTILELWDTISWCIWGF